MRQIFRKQAPQRFQHLKGRIVDRVGSNEVTQDDIKKVFELFDTDFFKTSLFEKEKLNILFVKTIDERAALDEAQIAALDAMSYVEYHIDDNNELEAGIFGYKADLPWHVFTYRVADAWGTSQDQSISLRLDPSETDRVYNDYFIQLNDNDRISVKGITAALLKNRDKPDSNKTDGDILFICRMKCHPDFISASSSNLFLVLISNINILYYTDPKSRPSKEDYDNLLSTLSIDRNQYTTNDIYKFISHTPVKSDLVIVDDNFLVINFLDKQNVDSNTTISFENLEKLLSNIRMVLRCKTDGTYLLYRYDNVVDFKSQLGQSKIYLLGHIVYLLSKRDMWSHKVCIQII